ncbi:aquaporin-7 isoform X2 [Microcebus murinus]|uniref:aquaporin-7 isoform X2 n=1 Tax=Microcebus murinus TaxID=30608 RepID=UPI000643B91E|nr:aquaporin-7 isoform X2 [Microcebus murinus]
MSQVIGQRRSTRSTRMNSSSVITSVHTTLRRQMVQEFLAECLSTYVMMVFGLGSVAHMVLGNKTFGSYLGVNLGFGFGVTMGVYIAGNISGAHMNSAVTFTSCALGRMPWKKFPVYVLGQFLGSFMAAATIYGLFYPIIHFSSGELTVTGPTATGGIFATYLPDHMTLWRGFVDEVIVTGMLQLCLCAITDKDNPEHQGTQPLVIGFLIVIIGVGLGMNSGYAINPSRDLPPRFFTYLAGWGTQVFRAGDNWWWVPVVAPPLGAYLGGIVYLVFIGSSTSRKPKKLEDPAAYEDHRISSLPKTSHDPSMMSSLTPASVAPTTRSPVSSSFTPVSVPPIKRSSFQPAPPVRDSVNEEHF